MNELVHKSNHDLYGEDGLICVPANIRANNVIRKKLFRVLEKFGFKYYCRKKYENSLIFFNVKLSLPADTVSLNLKRNTNLKYVNTKSNHTENVIKHITKGVDCRIPRNSSTEKIFEQKKMVYVKALRREGHKTGLILLPPARPKRKTRRRDMILFNLSFNLQLKTKISKPFFKLLDNTSEKSLL